MAEVAVDKKALIEGERPMYNASYGKLMMWFFLVSDAFTFSALLIAYGALRVSSVAEGKAWALPEDVFTHAPILHEVWHLPAPLVFVGLMTFILILSSVTMVLAVEAGHRKSKQEVSKWVFWTIIGGSMFLGCQAYEWYHFIHGTSQGGILLTSEALSVMEGREKSIPDHEIGEELVVYPILKAEPIKDANGDVVKDALGKPKREILELRVASNGYIISSPELVRLVNAELPEKKDEHGDHGESHSAPHGRVSYTQGGANLKANEYGPPGFAALFFFVTGFHGTHVFSGVCLLVMLLVNINKGTYERRGHYEMTEKIGLYWHFVDLVWVFVFTFFYLV